MYDSIRGKIEKKGAGYIILSTSEINFKLLCSDKLIESVDLQSENNRILVHLKHDEKGMVMYGFVDEAEREMFLKIIKIPSFGCNKAVSILSKCSPEFLQRCRSSKDLTSLCWAGLTEKTAQKIVELLKV